MNNIEQKFTDLIKIITRLRQPDGCPWDQKQTPQTFKGYLVEETHELLEAINDNNPQHVLEELGDLLFQIIFLNNLYEEEGHFTLVDVIDHISAKMIRRHPHVFGEQKIETEKELKAQWQKIKDAESKTSPSKKGVFSSIPKSLPALRRAQKVGGRAARCGFDWPNIKGALNKFKEESAELENALTSGNQHEINEEFGDLLFSLAILGRKANVDTEDALRAATEKFSFRFYQMEQALAEQNMEISDLGTDELIAAWNAAKALDDEAKNI